jgi:RIO kinase 1
MKIPKRLQPLVEDGLVEAVIRPLMSGKEAAVLVVRSGGEVRCAKVYKEATNRSFRQRADYQEGRGVRNSRRARAMAKRSKFGKAELEEAWQSTEVDTIYKLSRAGVRVPKPFMFSDGVLIMELVVDADGNAAPRLNDVQLTEDRARRDHAFLLNQVVRMLCAGLIHGDLSEYNVLVGPEGPVIIDFPQAVDAAGNQNARRMLLRDVDNMRAYFSRFAPELGNTSYGKEIWKLYERGELHPEVELTGVVEEDTRQANVDGVLQDIEDAREEHHRRFGRKVVDIPLPPPTPAQLDERSGRAAKQKASGAQATGDARGSKKRRRRGNSRQGASPEQRDTPRAASGQRPQGSSAPQIDRSGAPPKRQRRRRQPSGPDGGQAPQAPRVVSSEAAPADGAPPKRQRRPRQMSGPDGGQASQTPQVASSEAAPADGAPPKRRRRRRRRKLSDSTQQANTTP